MSRLTDEYLDIIARDTTDRHVRMLAKELQERRAADLPSGDIDQIMLAVAVIREMRESVTDNEFRARLHIIDDVLMRVAENAYKQTALYRAALDAVGMKP
jgi:hypothetical protein